MTTTPRRYAESLLADAHRVEVRTLPDRRVKHFAGADDLVAYVSGVPAGQNVYSSLNRPRPDAPADCPLRDEHIGTIVRLPFDFDPARPAACGSTAAEHAAAIEARDAFVRRMLAADWPMPLLGDSGNGAHAVYRTFLPATDETRELLRVVYRGLGAEHSTDAVSFDVSVRNPARIWRLYGTVNRKGIAAPDRPHRVASCLIPADWARVPTKAIERLAKAFARNAESTRQSRLPALLARTPIVGAGDYRTLDIVGWFAARGLYVAHVRDHVHEVECPWEHEHSSSTPGDTVIFAADGSGWPGFSCRHLHCADRSIRDVLALWADADAFCSRSWGAA